MRSRWPTARPTCCRAGPEKDKPALVMRIDMGNPYNAQRHRVMWSMLQNHDEPIIGALEMDAACVVVNLFMLPDEPELFRQCVENISRVRADCHRYGMPLMIEPLVMLPNEVRGGYQVDGDAEKIVTLVRLASEMGADIIKADPTDDPEDFHRVVEAARVPVLVRGGGKEDLKAVLTKSAALMGQGAKGMVYGRNIYQHANPKAVVQRADGDHPSGRQRRGSVGHLQPWLTAAPIFSGSMPATPSSRRCCSTRRAGSSPCTRIDGAVAPAAAPGMSSAISTNCGRMPARRSAGCIADAPDRSAPASRRSAVPAMATGSTCSTATGSRCSASSRSTRARRHSPRNWTTRRAERMHAICLQQPWPSQTPVLLAWLKRHRPELYARAGTLLLAQGRA